MPSSEIYFSKSVVAFPALVAVIVVWNLNPGLSFENLIPALVSIVALISTASNVTSFVTVYFEPGA